MKDNARVSAQILGLCWVVLFTGVVRTYCWLQGPRHNSPDLTPGLLHLAELADDDGAPPALATCAGPHAPLAIALLVDDDNATRRVAPFVRSLSAAVQPHLPPGGVPSISIVHAPDNCHMRGLFTDKDALLNGPLVQCGMDAAWTRSFAHLPDTARRVLLLPLPPEPGRTKASQAPAEQQQELSPEPGIATAQLPWRVERDGTLVIGVRGMKGDSSERAAAQITPLLDQHWPMAPDADVARACRRHAAHRLRDVWDVVGHRGWTTQLRWDWEAAARLALSRGQAFRAATASAALQEHPDLDPMPGMAVKHIAAVLLPLALPIATVLARHTARCIGAARR